MSYCTAVLGVLPRLAKGRTDPPTFARSLERRLEIEAQENLLLYVRMHSVVVKSGLVALWYNTTRTGRHRSRTIRVLFGHGALADQPLGLIHLTPLSFRSRPARVTFRGLISAQSQPVAASTSICLLLAFDPGSAILRYTNPPPPRFSSILANRTSTSRWHQLLVPPCRLRPYLLDKAHRSKEEHANDDFETVYRGENVLEGEVASR